jgi:leucyl-tRNA synthetase
VPAEKSKEKEFVLEQAKQQDNIQRYLDEGTIVKEIFVPGRIINLVVKPN